MDCKWTLQRIFRSYNRQVLFRCHSAIEDLNLRMMSYGLYDWTFSPSKKNFYKYKKYYDLKKIYPILPSVSHYLNWPKMHPHEPRQTKKVTVHRNFVKIYICTLLPYQCRRQTSYSKVLLYWKLVLWVNRGSKERALQWNKEGIWLLKLTRA